jgi:hypothetical protein
MRGDPPGDRESPIIGASAEVAENLDSLSQSISILRDRLTLICHPIDRPETVDREGPKSVPGPVSKFTSELASYASSLRGLRREVSEMIESLDL